MLELVKMLQNGVERKAAEAQAEGKLSIAAWREVQTKQLLESFKADLQRLDFASLPQFKGAISSIGLAQQQLKMVSPALTAWLASACCSCSLLKHASNTPSMVHDLYMGEAYVPVVWHRQHRSEAVQNNQS